MEMFQIRYALTAARTLNFTRAAAECGVSQPALTKAVRSLEAELGAPLFHRDGRQMRLSGFGESLLPHLEQILSEAEHARLLAENYRLMEKVPLRLGVMSSVGHVRLSRFLARFQREHDGIEISVAEAPVAELRRRLAADTLDLAVLNPVGGPDDLNVHDLYAERYVVVFPPEHRLGGMNGVRLADLSGEHYVDRLACEMRETVMAVCKDRAIELHTRFRSEREDWVQAMVLARIGFAFMPEYAVTLPELMQRPLIDPQVGRTISLAWVAGRRLTPAATAMMRAAQRFAWPG